MRAGAVVAGRFEIETVVATGGMGTVFRARDLDRQVPVAVKILQRQDSVDSQRFAREVSVLAELSHPGIVKYIASGANPDGMPFLVMEWVGGETLAHCLESVGLTLVESVGITRQLAEALAVAHARNLVHRDIKPSNVLLVDGSVDRVKLIDFGLARRSWHAPVGYTLTRTGTMLGTPGYMAPEQARGERDLDARADVFALGCVFYECLTGRPAFGGEKETAVLAKILLREPPPVRSVAPDVPGRLEVLVQKMLAKAPAGRPENAAVVARELAGLGALPSTARRRCGEPEPLTPRIPTTSATEWVHVIFVGTRQQEVDESAARVRAATAPHGATFEALADGAIVALFAGTGARADEAWRAMECALAVLEILPESPIAVAGGPSLARGEVLERGARTLEAGTLAHIFRESVPDDLPVHAVWLDEETADLIGPRHPVRQHAMGRYLMIK